MAHGVTMQQKSPRRIGADLPRKAGGRGVLAYLLPRFGYADESLRPQRPCLNLRVSKVALVDVMIRIVVHTVSKT